MFIDEREAAPYYHQIKNDILSKIQSGVYREGRKIDSEITLCRMYGVSRPTVRKAIEELVYAGHLWRRQGKGTFVNEVRIHKNLNELTPFWQDIKSLGKRLKLKVLLNKRVAAPAHVAARIGVEPRADVLKVVAIRMADDLPVVYRTSYYVTDIMPTLQQTIREDMSISDALHQSLGEASGLFISRAVQTFRVVPAKAREARHLDLPQGAPLILWEGVNYLNTGRAVEFYLALSNSEKYTFSIEQTRR